MKEIFIKELLGLKSKLKKVLEEEKDSLRIWFNVGYEEYLILIRSNNHSTLYPEVNLFSIKYYRDEGDQDGEKLWSIHGEEYFLEKLQEEVLNIFMKRLISDDMMKESGEGYSKKECIGAYHNMRKS
ncbi:hypothetical protein ACTOJ1_001425 [Shigella flexneri]